MKLKLLSSTVIGVLPLCYCALLLLIKAAVFMNKIESIE